MLKIYLHIPFTLKVKISSTFHTIWKLIHVCYSILLYPCLTKKLAQLPNYELMPFSILVRMKNSMTGMYETNIDCSFIQGMVENYCTLDKIQPWPTIHLGDNNFSPFPSWVVNICTSAYMLFVQNWLTHPATPTDCLQTWLNLFKGHNKMLVANCFKFSNSWQNAKSGSFLSEGEKNKQQQQQQNITKTKQKTKTFFF